MNGDRIGIAGTSMGANLGLRAAARHLEIKCGALLSPGMLLWRVDISEAIVDNGQRHLLLVAAEKDTHAAHSARELNELALGERKLRMYPGAAHGTAMLESHPRLECLLFDWFRDTMQ